MIVSKTLALAGLAFALVRSAGAQAGGGYLEPDACATCHPQIAESYARTGMARTFGSAAEAPAGTFYHEPSDQHFAVAPRGGKSYLKRYQSGPDGAATNILESSLDYWIGSGNHGRSYLHRTAADELVELPLTWYSEGGGQWAMSPAYDRPDHAGFSRRATYRCMFCHNAYPPIAPGADGSDGGTRFPARLAQGIDCQRCHGPGQAHVEAVRKGAGLTVVRQAIVNPAKLPVDRQMEVCLQCHLETTTLRLPDAIKRYDRGVFSYRPGEPLGDYLLTFDFAKGSGHEDRFDFSSEPYRLRQSACFRESRAVMTCTTCHNPHDVPRGADAAVSYAKACRGCHESKVAALVVQQRHPAGQDCVSCHMAKRHPADAIHVVVTDHLIQRRPPAEVTPPKVERTSGNTPAYQGEVALYDPAELPQTPENELYLAVAQVAQQSNLKAGLPRLESAVAKYSPRQDDFYLELADGYRHADALDKALPVYEYVASRSPKEWRAWYGLGLTRAALGNADGAVKALQQSLELTPREPVRRTLASILSRQGKLPEAIAVLRQAIAADPESADVRNDLGAALLKAGDAGEAEKSLREAVRLRPESAAIRVNLATLLARSGKLTEAKSNFEAVLRLDPAAATRNALGNLLLQMGDSSGAAREYRAAIAAAPAVAVSYYNLGTALAGQGRIVDAESAFRDAVARQPAYFEAHLRLGQLLLGRGRTEEAAPHLRQAADSPNVGIRNTALELLATQGK